MHSRRPGFTLIELLIVVVIVGILASIAIPKFRNTKGKANVAAIKSDLRNLATAEEAYLYDNGIYTSDVSQLRYNNTAGVQILGLRVNGGAGWAAMFTHPMAEPLTCYMYVGDVVPYLANSVDGQVTCQ